MRRIILLITTLITVSLNSAPTEMSSPSAIDPHLELVDKSCTFSHPCAEGIENELRMTVTMINRSVHAIDNINAKIWLPEGGRVLSQSLNPGTVEPGEHFILVVTAITSVCDINRILVSFDGTIRDPKNNPERAAITVNITAANSNCGFNLDCHGASNGTATATASGGASPYTFLWSDGQTGPNANNLSAGPIAVKVTDANGEIAFDNTALSEPPPMIINNLFQHASGPTSNDGIIQLNVQGGCPSYSFQWTGPGGFNASSQNIINLVPGTYNVTVTDQNGCSANESYNVTWGNNDNISPVITCPANISTNTASGSCTASVTYTQPVGTDNQAGATTQIIGGLGSGANFPTGITVEVYQVTDQAGNKVACAFTVQVSDNEAPVAQCQNASVVLDSSGFVFVGGGLIDNGSSDNCTVSFTTTVPPVFDCSATGTNTVTLEVIDASGNTSACSATLTVSDTLPPTISCPANIVTANDSGQAGAVVNYSAPSVNDNCPGSSLTLTSGGASGSFFATGTNPVNYTATDASSNSSSCTFTVTVTADTLATSISSPTYSCGFNVPCPSGNGGSIDLTVTGGITPYSYYWTGPGNFSATTEDLNNVGGGTYNYTVTDNNSSTIGGTFSLTEPPTLDPNLSSTTYNCGYNIKCWGDPTGDCTSAPTGGCGPYTYAWSTGSSAPTITGISAGTYSVTVTDDNGCTASSAYTVTDAPQYNFNAVITNATGPNATNGSIDITPTGGCPPYTFTWTGPNNFLATTEDINNVGWGKYYCAVVDANNWKEKIPFDILCIPQVCIAENYNTLIFMTSTTDETAKNGEGKEGWGQRSESFVSEEYPLPTGDNYRVLLTNAGATTDQKDKDFPKFDASFGGLPWSACKPCDNACEAVGPAYTTGTKYGMYNKSITTLLCPLPNSVQGGNAASLRVARFDASGKKPNESKDQFPQSAVKLHKRSGILIENAGQANERIVGEPVIIVLSGGESVITEGGGGGSLTVSNVGKQKPSLYGVKHVGLNKWKFEARDIGFDVTKYNRLWIVEDVISGALDTIGSGTTQDAELEVGRWNIILKYTDKVSKATIAKAELHSIVVEKLHTDNVKGAVDSVPCPVGRLFELEGRCEGGTTLDAAVYARPNVKGSSAPRARVSLDGYPQNEYWGGATDAFDLPQHLSVIHYATEFMFLQGYENLSKSNHDIMLHVDGQAFIEACVGDHAINGKAVKWRWDHAEQEPFNVLNIDASLAKCDEDSIVDKVCMVQPLESLLKKTRGGNGKVKKNKVVGELEKQAPKAAFYVYAEDKLQKGGKAYVRVRSLDAAGNLVDVLKKNGKQFSISKCAGTGKSFSSDKLWVVPNNPDPKRNLDEDKQTIRGVSGGKIVLDYYDKKKAFAGSRIVHLLNYEILLDANQNMTVDAADTMATFVRPGLFNSAYNAAGSLVLNGATDATNFVGRDSARFYFRIADATRNLNPFGLDELSVNWSAVNVNNAAVLLPMQNTQLHLFETGNNTGIFVSRALMMVQDTHDLRQITNTGLPARPGIATRNQANHRTRQIDLTGGVRGLYKSTGKVASRCIASAPACDRTPEKRRDLPFMIINYFTWNDTGFDHDGNALTPDIGSGNGVFDFDDTDGDGNFDPGETGEGGVTPYATNAYINAQIAQAQKVWNGSCVRLRPTTPVLRPMPAAALNLAGNYPGSINNAFEVALHTDIIGATPKPDTLVVVFVPLQGANAYATVGNRTNVVLGNRFIIHLNVGVNPVGATMAHELFHVLYNRYDKTDPHPAWRYITFHTRASAGNPWTVTLPDVRVRRRFHENCRHWVRRARTARFPIGQTIGVSTATTGNTLVNKFK